MSSPSSCLVQWPLCSLRTRKIFPWFLLTFSAISFSFATFAFLIFFYTLWTLFGNPPRPPLYLMLNVSHTPLSYLWLLFFNLFIRIVDPLITRTACKMTPGFILIYVWILFISKHVLHFFPHLSPCAFYLAPPMPLRNARHRSESGWWQWTLLLVSAASPAPQK